MAERTEFEAESTAEGYRANDVPASQSEDTEMLDADDGVDTDMPDADDSIDMDMSDANEESSDGDEDTEMRDGQ